MKSAILISVLTKYDDIAINTASEFFRRHNMTQLEERVRFGYTAYFGAIRPLAHVLIKIFRLNSRKFIRFYEGIFRSREAPHYEDALAVVTLILVAIGIFLSPIIGVEYANWKKRAKKDGQSISVEDYKEPLDLFKYLIKAFALREAYYVREISRKEFLELRKIAKDVTLKPTSNKYSKEALGKLERIWSDFNDTTNFQFDEQLLNELITLAADKMSGARVVHPKLKEPQKGDFITLKGLGVSSGQVRGFVKVVNSYDDIGKVIEGDIIVLQYCNPEMVPALRKCAASIGLPRCGGRTGHLAIVCRELGIPCVVYLEDWPFEDGVEAIVDGSKGQIRITL